jgi:RNase P subunit RPR2
MAAPDNAQQKQKRDPRKKKPPVVVKKAAPGSAAPAPRGRDDKRPQKDGPKFFGGPRNEFGTRVARRVTCARCGTSDHVPYVPKDPSKALCRTCAAEVLSTYEAGVRVRTPTRKTTCNLCGAPFDLPISAEDDGDPLCPSCLRGFTSWQGSVDVPFEERQQVVVEERLSGALVRKRKTT